MGRNIDQAVSQFTFEIFRDPIGHWCARRSDGKVCGTFFEREAAVRFARREGGNMSLPVLIMGPAGER